MSTLIELVTTLARARAAYDQAIDAEDKAEEEMMATPAGQEYKRLIEAANAANKARNEADAALRKATLDVFKVDANKTPLEGLEIKTPKTVTIPDPAAAKDWCLHNFTPALRLDTSAFEKAAKDGSIPTNLATVAEEPKVYVASDLSKYA